MDLRARLLAARGVQTDCTPSVSVSQSVEPTSRSLSSDELEHVEELIQEIGVNGPAVDTSASTVSISQEEQNDINEMISNLTSSTEESSEDEDEYDEEPEEQEVEVPEPQPEPEPEPIPESVVAPMRRRARRRTLGEHNRYISRTAQEATSRFSGASWYDSILQKDVTIIGVGGIGSWTALLISRLGVKNMTLYDDDTVELGNMSGQFYRISDIDRPKVDAIASAVAHYSCYSNVTAIPERFSDSSFFSPVVIACLDSMSARKTAFTAWRKAVDGTNNKEDYLFIDGRLSAETLQVFAVSGDDEDNINRYEATLFDDSEADSEICSYKQTSFMANMIASVITNVFVNYVASKLEGGAAREIPFKTEYLGEMMWLKTEM